MNKYFNAFMSALIVITISNPALAQMSTPASVEARLHDPSADVLTYSELMALPDVAQEAYIAELRETMVYLSNVPNAFGGHLFVQEEPSDRANLFALLATSAPAVAAQGSCGTGYYEETWGTQKVCSKYGVEGDANCNAIPNHTLIRYSGSFLGNEKSRCISDADYAKIKDTDAFKKDYQGRLSQMSADKKGLGADATVKPSALAARDEARRAADRDPNDGLSNAQPKEAKTMDGFDPSKDCLDRKGEPKTWQTALKTYQAGKNNQCIYAGNFSTYAKKANSEEPDIAGTKCMRTDKAQIGDKTVACASPKKVLCNAFLFGVEGPGKDGNFVGRCVNRGSNATESCEKQYQAKLGQAGGSRQTRRQKAREAAEFRKNAEAELAGENPKPATGAPTAADKELKNFEFWKNKLPGIEGQWNDYASKISSVCDRKDFRAVHCSECDIIRNRLASARAAMKKMRQSTGGGNTTPSGGSGSGSGAQDFLN